MFNFVRNHMRKLQCILLLLILPYCFLAIGFRLSTFAAALPHTTAVRYDLCLM